MFLLYLLLSVFGISNTSIDSDLNSLRNDYAFLIKYYDAPFLIENEENFIKKLEKINYLSKNSEPIYLKLLIQLYKQNKNTEKLSHLYRKYGIINNFKIFSYDNIEYFDELEPNILEKLLQGKKIDKIENTGNYILKTTCKFKHPNGIYLYNDLSDEIYINNQKISANAFIIKNNSNKTFFNLSIKLHSPPKGLLYIKGAFCNKNFKINTPLRSFETQKADVKIKRQNTEIILPQTAEEIENLIKKDNPKSNYILYNYFILNDMPYEAYKYLKKWSEKCNNYYVKKEKYEFYKEYIPNKLKDNKSSSKTYETYEKNYKYKDINFTKFNALPSEIKKNEIIFKEIILKKRNNRYISYIHYVIAVKNALNFSEYFKISPEVNILGLFKTEIKSPPALKIPIEAVYTESEVFLKEIKNNIFLEIYLKKEENNLIFIPEKYFPIKTLKIFFDKNIKYKFVNFDKTKYRQNTIKNISAYFPMPNDANILEFLPYIAIKEKIKLPNTLKWYYFYKSLINNHIVKKSFPKLSDIKKAYYFYQKKNEPLKFYLWSKIKKLKTELLIFSLKNDIYGEKLFNYPIIKYKNNYLDLNLKNLSYSKLPPYLKNKEYISIDENGFYIYHGKEKILDNFVTGNNVKIKYKILKNLDYAEFEMNITLNDFYTTALKEIIKNNPNEEFTAYLLENYLNKYFNSASLIDYEVKNQKNRIEIYIKAILKSPLNYFEIKNNEFLTPKNYFQHLFTTFLTNCPPLLDYTASSEIENPIEMKCIYAEKTEIEISLEDEDYQFTETTNNSRKIIGSKIKINDSFFELNKIIHPKNYSEFRNKISDYLKKRKSFFKNIRIVRKND